MASTSSAIASTIRSHSARSAGFVVTLIRSGGAFLELSSLTLGRLLGSPGGRVAAREQPHLAELRGAGREPAGDRAAAGDARTVSYPVGRAIARVPIT